MKLGLTSHFSFSQTIILLLLFLGSMNVGNLYFYFIFCAFFVCVLANSRHVKVDILVVVLLLFSLSYLVFYPGSRESITSIVKQFVFPMSYLIGRNFVRQGRRGSAGNGGEERQMSAVIMVLAMGAFVHYLLNMWLNMDGLSRNTIDIWTGEVIVATGQACLAVMATGVFSVWLFFRKSKMQKVVALLGLVLIFAYNLVLAGRTLLLLMVLVLCVAFFHAMKTSGARQKGKIIFLTVLGLLAALFVYIQDLFGVREWILGSNLSARFDNILLYEDTRLYNKYLYIMNIFRYPFGGGELFNKVGGYAHELYLDVFSDTGIIGLLLIVIFVIDSAVKAWKIVRSEALSRDFRALVLCVYVAVLTEFYLEPIVQGVPWLFCAFCIFSGMFSRIRPRMIDVKEKDGQVSNCY